VPVKNDIILSSNQLLDALVEGYTNPPLTGLQERVDDIFPDKDIQVSTKYPEYLLPGDSNFNLKPDKPYITISDQTTSPESLFKRDVVPRNEDYLGWVSVYTLRFDVWGRTPPECKDITDELEVILKRLGRQLWSQMRIQLDVSGASDVLEEVTGLPQFYHKFVTVYVKVFRMKEV